MFKRIIITIFILYNLFYLIDFPTDSEVARLIFFDVGQGDSALLISPSGKTVLIDGGPDAAVNQKISKYLKADIKNINWAILSHDHRDHFYGLISLSDYYQFDNYIGPLVSDLKVVNSWLKDLENKGTIIWSIEKKIIQHNLEDNCYFQVLRAPIMFLKDNISVNNLSTAIKISCWEIQALLIGDAEKESELLFMEYATEEFLQSDIFKANHHGSKTSNHLSFLIAISPKYVVISAGKDNRYKHPHKESLDNFKKLDLIVYRTDKDGDIQFLANRKEILIK